MTIEIDVERRLGDFHIQAQFDSEPGVTALFGRSGAGKSSVVNMISGLLKPDRGRIVVDGRVLFDSEQRINLPPRKRRVGYIFQESRLFPHLKVRRNLRYGQRFTPPGERYVQLEQIVDLLGIGHLLERRPPMLSGGERQRVAIGRALLASPRLLLMDEPLASLDAARKNEILPYIERLRDELKLPIVYVSHLFEEVTRLADMLVIMADGKLAAAGPLTEVTARLDLRVLTGRAQAGTVITAKVADRDPGFGLTRLTCAGGELVVPRVGLPPGAAVRVHIHASDVTVAVEPPRGLSVQNVLVARVVEVGEQPAPYTELRLDAEGLPIIAHVTAKAAHDLDLRVGCEVYALIKSVAIGRSRPDD
ncbi:MAG: molybdenum ABC transporter ATP-binding protein [Salinisphaera sp.]|nr:molybdenum ABC transporter ATP-binding protein [Salinisphaera sp.]MDN5938697.1 molybdenum ABC transporter ATP-binding protein [Salinisphaera sp.]